MISTHPAKHPPQKPLTDLAYFERVLRPLPTRTHAEALLALVVAAASSCSVLEPQGGGHPLTVLVDVADVSGSGDITARCAEVAARVRPVIEDPHTRHLDLLGLGTGSTAGEPSVLVPWTTYAPAAGLYESPASTARLARPPFLGHLPARVLRVIKRPLFPVPAPASSSRERRREPS